AACGQPRSRRADAPRRGCARPGSGCAVWAGPQRRDDRPERFWGAGTRQTWLHLPMPQPVSQGISRALWRAADKSMVRPVRRPRAPGQFNTNAGQRAGVPIEEYRQMLRGSIPALITPMRNGIVDEKAFASFVEWQIEQGSHGLVPVGTTGESPTVSHEEHNRVVEICVEVANGRVPVLAGAGSNSTAEAISLAQHAEKSGADAVLSVVPYYNKPSQEGLFQHFSAVAK